MNATKILIPFILFLFISLNINAQLRETFHDVYDLEEIETVELKVKGDVKFLKWKGTNLMMETIVELGNATRGILRYLIKKQRYELVSDSDGSRLTVASFDQERKAVITQDGSCDEYIGVIIYIPEDYEVHSDSLIVKSGVSLNEEEPVVTGDE